MNRPIRWRSFPRAARLLLAVAIALAGAACKSPPKTPPPPPPLQFVPDPDGTPEQARALTPGAVHRDSLDRNETRDTSHRYAPDLDDWYRIELASDGKLSVSMLSSAPSDSRRFTLALTNALGTPTTQAMRAGGRAELRTTADVKRGVYLVWIGSEPEAAATIPYEISVDFKPKAKPRAPAPPREPAPPPPPQTSWQTVSAGVLELEKLPNGSLVALIKGGQDRGLQTGQRGRFVEAGREIGSFRITEVYPKGSRVRVEGKLAAPIQSSTEVQVEFQN